MTVFLPLYHNSKRNGIREDIGQACDQFKNHMCLYSKHKLNIKSWDMYCLHCPALSDNGYSVDLIKT